LTKNKEKEKVSWDYKMAFPQYGEKIGFLLYT